VNISTTPTSAQGRPSAGTILFGFTISISSPAPVGGLTVHYKTQNGTAVGGNSAAFDYISIADATVDFAYNGSMSQTVYVTVNGNSAVLANPKTFFVVLTSWGASPGGTGNPASQLSGPAQGTSWPPSCTRRCKLARSPAAQCLHAVHTDQRPPSNSALISASRPRCRRTPVRSRSSTTRRTALP